MPKALIIGSGVAGTATALFLAPQGWDCAIFEARAEHASDGGLFLNVATNGLAVLEEVGLRERLMEDAHRCPYMEMYSGRGALLGVVPNGPAGDPDRGSAVVRRAWLNQVLRDAVTVAGIPITLGARLRDIREERETVTAVFADGRTAQGDIVIGADGVGSPTRRWIDDRAPEPAYSGLVSVGGTARVPGLAPTPQTQRMVFGARSFFGYLVRDDGTVLWFANTTEPEQDRESFRRVPAATWLERLRELHADDPSPVSEILAHVDGEIGAYPLYDLLHVPHWQRGRVVAVGDAVHATSPSAGQGASLALEDAFVLARCLREERDHAAAFSQYQSLRQPRAEEVVRYARAVNKQKRVTRSRLGIALRDAMLPMFLRKASSDTRNNHLYRGVVEEVAR
ncbi:FAD-dependent oxidoreductase [Microbacterium sp. PMB16]|uniref:FAD-dependent oxidoreductase n=1 Tax=Microbacterium sp. PMB16 TaxID=3120157 RepID=UPI003F4BDDE0